MTHGRHYRAGPNPAPVAASWHDGPAFVRQEAEIRRYWRAERPFDPQFDDFGRLSALAMLTEIDRLRRDNAHAYTAYRELTEGRQT